MSNNQTREKRVERATLRVLFRVPFFAPAVARLPITFQDGIGTACTDGHGIKMDPAFVDTLSDDQLVTLICHEACHPMLGHLWRAPESAKVDQASWDTWNKATDHAVNLMLKDFSKLVMGRDKVADPFPFPDPPEAYCANPAFAGMAEETIFNILNSEKDSQNAPGQKPGYQGSGKSSGKQGGGNPKAPGAGKSGGQPGSMPQFGQMTQPTAALDQSSQKKLRNDWEGTLINAVKMAQGRGDLPGGFERYVEELVSNQVPWTEILRSWLREQCADDWCWTEPALEYESSDFILPSLKSDKIGSVVFCVDTSGSINNELLAKFKAEMQSCLDDLHPSKVVEICCDTQIHSEREYRMGDQVALDAPGGGGTSFVPAIARCCDMDPKPRCVVYLTDGDGDYGADPEIPVIWVMYGGRKEAPYGYVVTV